MRREEFSQPSPEAYPLARWRWERAESPAAVQQQAERLAAGCGGVLLPLPPHWAVRPREEWLADLRAAAEACHNAGRRVYPYLREEDWRLAEPALAARTLVWETFSEVAALRAAQAQGERDIAALVAVPVQPEGTLALSDALVVTPFSDAELQGWLGGRPGRLFLFCTRQHDRLDVLNPVAVEQWWTQVVEPVVEELGELLTGAGLWVEAPDLLAGAEPPALAWSSRLPQAFYRQHRYDLWTALPRLVNGSPEGRAARQHYYETLSALLEEGLYEPLAEWCAQRRLPLTVGLRAGSLEEQVQRYAHPALAYRFAEPAVSGTEAVDSLPGRVAASLAHQEQWPRVWCGGKGRTAAEVKRWADRQATAGATQFLLMEGCEGESGEAQIRTYLARLSAFLRAGRHSGRVAVLWPLRSLWAHWGEEQAGQIEANWRWLSCQLARLHYDFDVLTEEVLQEAAVVSGQLRYGTESYELLILPPETIITAAVGKQIERFRQSGGAVLVLEPVPGAPGAEEFSRRFDASHLLPAQPPIPPLSRLITSGHTQSWGGFLPFRKAPSLARLAELRSPEVWEFSSKLLAKGQVRGGWARGWHRLLPPPLRLASADGDASDVLVWHLTEGETDAYFCLHTGETALHLEMEIPRAGVPELWEAETGEVRPVLMFTPEEKKLFLTLPFAPGEAKLLTVRPGRAPAVEAANFDVRAVQVSAEEVWVEGVCSHGDDRFAVVNLGERTVELTAPGEPPLAPVELAEEWQPVNNLADLGTIARAQTFLLSEEHVKGEVRLALPACSGVIAVVVNGQRMRERAWPPYEFDLSAAVRVGENALCVEARGLTAEEFRKLLPPRLFVARRCQLCAPV